MPAQILTPATLINDGYTLRATYPGLTAVGTITIDYRPMIAWERLWMAAAASHYSRSDSESGDAIVCNCVASKILFWSLRLAPSAGQLLCWHKSHDPLFEWIAETVCGNAEQEKADADNIQTGTPLYIRYRHLGHDTCRVCQEYLFDPETGELELDDLDNSPIPRFPEAVLACQTEEGCPNGTPDAPRSLNVRNLKALRHYQECVATGRFPDDPIVARNAALFRESLSKSIRSITREEAERARPAIVPA